MTDMPSIQEIISDSGASEALQYLVTSPETAYFRPDLEDIFQQKGTLVAAVTIDQFLAANLLEFYGARIGISAFGRRTALIIEALNGGDIHEVYRKLRALEGAGDMYELVLQDMTKVFFQTLVDRPRFGMLYVCSPWVNPSRKEASSLRYAVMRVEKETGSTPEVLVVTRPPKKPPQTDEGLEAFIEIGAKIFFHPRLHTKLYIREPDIRGGPALAIVGSQNLTRSNMLELGIRINGDSYLINQLIRYFHQLLSWSTERQ
jgi:hypothetical protein